MRCVRWPRALYFLFFFFCFFFFFIKRNDRRNIYYLCRNTERQSLNNASQPSTDNAASLKASSIERKKELYISTYVYICVFTSPRWKEKQITSTHFRLFLAYFYNKCVIMYNKSIYIFLFNSTYFCVSNW